MILCVTANPAFDRIQTVPGFHAGQVWRAIDLTLCAGGKGVNVARAVKSLGGQALCSGFLGGHTGRMQAEAVASEGLPAEWTWIDGETRVSVIVVVPERQETTVMNEAGPSVLPSDWQRLCADVLRLARRADLVCLCGSLPPGLPAQSMADLITALKAAGRRVWLDTSGATLRAGLQAEPESLKVNAAEAAEVLGWVEMARFAANRAADQRASFHQAVRAAQTLLRGAIRQVVLTLGKDGAVMACRETASTSVQVWQSHPPALRVVSSIGSGDSFLAGLAVAHLSGLPASEALRWGVAAGSANALSAGGGRFTRQEFEQVLAQTSLAADTGSEPG